MSNPTQPPGDGKPVPGPDSGEGAGKERTGRRRGGRRGGRRNRPAAGRSRQEPVREKADGRRPPKGPPPPPPEGEDLVLVQFKGHRKASYHNRRNVPVKVGDYCLVEADRGRDLGRVNYIGPGSAEWWVAARKQGVLGVATERDLARQHDNRGDEWEFWDICQEKIQARKLNMNLVTVERQFDNKKITFYFTAEKRVDFRELVRDLAGVFRTRIELRQIGVRDEARLKGGLGICGREFCCSGFLQEFVPVTLKMAKMQQLPLNPGKLSGPCGRLRCCMTYENEVYQEARQRLPRVGGRVETPVGEGTVRKLDLLQESILVEVPGRDGLEAWPAAELSWGAEQDLPRPDRSKGRSRSGGDAPEVSL